MAFPEDALAPHEQLVLNLRPHAWVLIKPGALLILATVIGGVLAVQGENVVINLVVALAIVACAIFFLRGFVIWYSTYFVLTSDRVIYRAGVFTKTSIEIPLERINTVFSTQKIFERLIRIGDIEIESASEQGAQRFEDLRRPSDVQKEIYVQMEHNENRKFDRIGAAAQGGPTPTPTPTPVAGVSIVDQINQLASLRDQGHITEAEFQAKKSELLGRM